MRKLLVLTVALITMAPTTLAAQDVRPGDVVRFRTTDPRFTSVKGTVVSVADAVEVKVGNNTLTFPFEEMLEVERRPRNRTLIAGVCGFGGFVAGGLLGSSMVPESEEEDTGKLVLFTLGGGFLTGVLATAVPLVVFPGWVDVILTPKVSANGASALIRLNF